MGMVRFNTLIKQYEIPHDSYDCSEIAEDLYNMAMSCGLRGSIVKITPANGNNTVNIIEYGKVMPFEYHEVFMLDDVVYDIRMGYALTIQEYIHELHLINKMGYNFSIYIK